MSLRIIINQSTACWQSAPERMEDRPLLSYQQAKYNLWQIHVQFTSIHVQPDILRLRTIFLKLLSNCRKLLLTQKSACGHQVVPVVPVVVNNLIICENSLIQRPAPPSSKKCRTSRYASARTALNSSSN